MSLDLIACSKDGIGKIVGKAQYISARKSCQFQPFRNFGLSPLVSLVYGLILEVGLAPARLKRDQGDYPPGNFAPQSFAWI
jgi:hypothetical protein